MKQMIYRRIGSANHSSKGADGYTVAAKAESITARQLSEAQLRAKIPPLVGRQSRENLFYKQFQLDESTLAVSCGYDDPQGERGSVLVQTMMNESLEERDRYLARLPACSAYFADVEAEYAETGKLGVEGGDMLLSLDDYLARAQCAPEDALDILCREFGSEELLRQMFSAVLDVASRNARMIVVFLNDETMAALTDHGRRIAEALLACLPAQVAAAVGYQSPALDDSDNTTFGLRFAKRERFLPGKAQSYTYYVDAGAGTIQKPRQVDDSAAEYVQELAGLVMCGDAAALERVRALRTALNDSALYMSANIPGELSIRYALTRRPGELTPSEVRRVVDWHHAMIDAAAKKDAVPLERTSFWARVDDWVAGRYLPWMWDNQSRWKKRDPLYDSDCALRVLDDAQRLYAAGRPEAARYARFVEERLFAGRLWSVDPQRLSDRLIADFIRAAERAGRARSAAPLREQLFWPLVERWMRTVWLNARPAPRSRDVYRALEQLYALDALPERERYVDAYSQLIFEGRDALYTPNESAFHAAVTQVIQSRDPRQLSRCMAGDLRGRNPYVQGEALPVWLWYRKLAVPGSALESEFREANRRCFAEALRKCRPENLSELTSELENGGRLIACARRLDPDLPAREEIENHIVAMTRSAGLFGLYPDQIEAAGVAAKLLDRESGGHRRQDEHRALSEVCGMDVNRLMFADFERFAEIVTSGLSDGTKDRARELLAAAMGGWKGRVPAEVDMNSLLLALSMLSLEPCGDEGAFALRPERAMGALERLELPQKRLLAHCRKAADERAREGVGYLADVMYCYLRQPERRRTGEAAPYPRPRRARRAPLEGLPLAVPIAGILVFGGGLAAAALGLIHYIGLL